MKNITITLPDELAHRAKVFAAEQNTSVSKYVGGLLAEKMKAEQGYQVSMRNWLRQKPVAMSESTKAYPKREALYE